MESLKDTKSLVFTADGWSEVNASSLFLMPAAIGSTVYSCDPAEIPQVTSADVTGYEYESGEWWVVVKENERYGLTVRVRVADLGKSWFLDEADARVAVRELNDFEAEDIAYKKGIREGKSQFAAELKEYIYRNYGESKGAVRATASHITDMIDALMYGTAGWGPIPSETDFERGLMHEKA